MELDGSSNDLRIGIGIMIIYLICETENCMNQNIAIPFKDPAERCICGVCMNEITKKLTQEELDA